MKRKVGILTYHFALNYGAVLQCYALYKALCKQGHDVSVINLVTYKQEENNLRIKKTKGIKNVILQIMLFPFLKDRIQKKEKFQDFIKQNINCTVRYTEDNFQKNVSESNYDVIIVGSDQVWNPHIADFTDKFFLPGEYKARKVGYAISIGTTKKEDILPYKQCIQDFSDVGLREQSAIKTIDTLYGNELVEVLDPTFLLEESEWHEMTHTYNQRQPYMVCYFLKKENFKRYYRIAKEIANNKKIRIIYINQRYSWRSFYPNTLCDVGPQEFVSLIRNANYVCTDSFHGTVFSIIFRKNFSTIVDSYNSLDRRKQDILSKLGLIERCIILDEYTTYSDSEINYEVINKKITLLREESLNFLKNVMSYE